MTNPNAGTPEPKRPPGTTTTGVWMQHGIDGASKRRARRTEWLAAAAVILGGGGALYAVSIGVSRGNRIGALEQETRELRAQLLGADVVGPTLEATPLPDTELVPPSPDSTGESEPPQVPTTPAPTPTPAGDEEFVQELRRVANEVDSLAQALASARAERDYFLAEAARRDLRLRELEAAAAQLGQPVPPPPPETRRPQTYEDMVRRAGLPRDTLTDGATQPAGAFEDGSYRGSSTGHTLNARSGGSLTLEDGSQWETHRTSRSEILVWRPGDELELQLNPVGPDGFTYLIKNLTRRSQAAARLTSQ